MNKEYLTQIFPARNGVTPNPRVNVNYPKDDPSVLRQGETCDYITELLVEKIPKDQRPFLIFEVGAWIGLQTVSFLNNSGISGVYAFESSSDAMSKYLANNLDMYKLRRRARIEKKAFTGVPEKFKGAVVFMDPTWADPETGETLEQGIMVEGKTLEEWLDELDHCALVAFYLPPDYKLASSDKFFYDTTMLRDEDGRNVSKIITCTPYIVDEWQSKLAVFIDEMLQLIEKKPEKRALYTSPENMEIWERGFTHESYSRTSNYEELEMIGDAVLHTFFTVYLNKKYPKLKKDAITHINAFYMSEQFQPLVSRKYGFERYIRTTKTPNRKMLEDVFESFFGSIFFVGNKVMPGLGYILGEKMSHYMFSHIDIDLDKAEGSAKTVFGQIFQRLQFSVDAPATETIPTGNRDYQTTIKINGKTQAYFKSEGIKIPLTIGKSFGQTEKVSESKAYEDALLNMRNAGVTNIFIETKIENHRLGYLQDYPAVKEKSLKQGYVVLKFSDSKNSREVIAQLLGSSDLGDWDILASYIEAPENYVLEEAKKTVLASYLAEPY